jgi:hypothetical protein
MRHPPTHPPADHAGPADGQILSESECAALFSRLRGFARYPEEILPEITSWWTGELCWSQNRVTVASDRRDVTIVLKRRIDWPASGST